MATITVDTNIMVFAAERKKHQELGRDALTFLGLLKIRLIKLGVDSNGVIETEYREYISKNWDTRTWWSDMLARSLIDRYLLSPKQRGPYPENKEHNLSEVDKLLMDVANLTDTKILVSEDSDFYRDKSKTNAHPVIIQRGIKLKRLKAALDEMLDI